LLAVLATYALLLLRYRRSLRPVLLSLTLCALLVGVVRGPVYRALDVKPFDTNMSRMLVSSLFVWPIMAHVHRGTPVSDRDAQVLRDWDPNRTGFWEDYRPERQMNLDQFVVIIGPGRRPSARRLLIISDSERLGLPPRDGLPRGG
jgi:hypothetical protein